MQFFPKTEKYVSLFMGSEDEQVVAKRNDLRERIKANLLAAAAAGVDLEGALKELFKIFFANVLVNVKV
jgi:DNA invertase Pin-like site-specific DNA recombinase